MGGLVKTHKSFFGSEGLSKGRATEETTALMQAMQSLLGETKEIRGEYTKQLMEALTTGGVGARIPIISKAMEASKRATSQSVRGAEENITRSGFAGTPFGEAILANISREGAYTTSQIGPQYAQQLISGIPGYVGGTLQAATQGMGTAAQASASVRGAATTATGNVASGFSSGGCCFIFIASHGYLHPIVRRYRDMKMTVRNRRGYYWLSDRLVPLMKRSCFVKTLVDVLMVKPMTIYGKYYFGLNKYGFVFGSITSFWLRVFSLLGFQKPYKRRGTEEVV